MHAKGFVWFYFKPLKVGLSNLYWIWLY